MKRLYLSAILALLLFIPSMAQAQRTAGGGIYAADTTCTTGVCQSITVGDEATAAIQVQGSYSGTLQFEGTTDDANWFSIYGTPPSGSDVSSTTSTGFWQFKVAGMSSIRVRCSSYSSGVAAVSIKTTKASFSSATISSAGDATASNQETMITALQIIDNIAGTFGSATPATGVTIGGSDGTNLRPATALLNNGKYALAVVSLDSSGDPVYASYLDYTTDDVTVYQASSTNNPCATDALTQLPINQAGSAQLVAASAGEKIYVCGGMLSTAADETVTFIEGTGTVCATSTNDLSGDISLPADGNGFIINRLQTNTASDALCLEQAGSVSVDGWILYVQK